MLGALLMQILSFRLRCEGDSLPEVEVLLATYNGARFLREQIDSIMTQDYGNIRVLARDDGSSDGTIEILAQYANGFPAVFE